jgi:(2Fe-2S) ferredoxin
MMIWPEGLWHMKVTKDDIPQIVDQYLKAEEATKTNQAAAAK